MGRLKGSIVLKDKSSVYFILISRDTVKQQIITNLYQQNPHVGSV